MLDRGDDDTTGAATNVDERWRCGGAREEKDDADDELTLTSSESGLRPVGEVGRRRPPGAGVIGWSILRLFPKIPP